MSDQKQTHWWIVIILDIDDSYTPGGDGSNGPREPRAFATEEEAKKYLRTLWRDYLVEQDYYNFAEHPHIWTKQPDGTMEAKKECHEELETIMMKQTEGQYVPFVVEWYIYKVALEELK